MDKIDVFIPAAISSKVRNGKEVDNLRKNYSELHELAGVSNKAFIEFNGKPMWKYTMETLDKCEHVRSITILGQTKETFPFETDKPVHYLEGGTSTFDTTMKAIDFFNSWDEPPQYIMNIPTDSPLLQPEMISRMVDSIDTTLNKEFFWNIIIAEDVYKHYPEISKVSFTLKEANLRFGDLHIMSPQVIQGREETLEIIMGNRKSMFGVVKLFGLLNLIKYAFKRIGVKELKQIMESRFNLRASLMITEFPEPCVDLDYAKDLDKFERWLAEEPRKLEDNERVVMIDTPEGMRKYLESRNYKKGEVPE